MPACLPSAVRTARITFSAACEQRYAALRLLCVASSLAALRSSDASQSRLAIWTSGLKEAATEVESLVS